MKYLIAAGKSIVYDICIYIYRYVIPEHINAEKKNYRYFADDISKCLFFNENVWVLLYIWLKFVPKVPIIYSTYVPITTKRQAIIWANNDYFIHAYMRYSVSISYHCLDIILRIS